MRRVRGLELGGGGRAATGGHIRRVSRRGDTRARKWLSLEAPAVRSPRCLRCSGVGAGKHGPWCQGALRGWPVWRQPPLCSGLGSAPDAAALLCLRVAAVGKESSLDQWYLSYRGTRTQVYTVHAQFIHLFIKPPLRPATPPPHPQGIGTRTGGLRRTWTPRTCTGTPTEAWYGN